MRSSGFLSLYNTHWDFLPKVEGMNIYHRYLDVAMAARGLLHCACRTSTASLCAFHEQWRSALHFLSYFYPFVKGGGRLWCSSLRPSREHRFTVRTLGAGGAPSRRTYCSFVPSKRVSRLPFTACVQRGPSEAARCASTEDHQAPFSSFLLNSERNTSTRGQLGGSSTARVERALFHRARSTSKGSYLAALTVFSARPSTPSPPSLSAAHHP